MPVLARDVRDRSFKTVLGGFDADCVRTALDRAAAAFEHVEAEIAGLQQQHTATLREIERIAELERSLLRACVAAEEDARMRCGAARRYATRIIAGAEEQANVLLEAPTRERDRIARDLQVIQDRRRHAADVLERLIAELQRPRDAETPREPAKSDGAQNEPQAAEARERSAEPPVPKARKSNNDSSQIAPPAPPAAPAPARESVAPAASSDVLGRAVPTVANDEATSGTWSDEQLAADPPADTPPGASTDADADVSERSRRVRVPVAAGAAAAVLLLLQGAAGVTQPESAPLTAAAFGPADAPPAGGANPVGVPDGGPAGPLAPAPTASHGGPSSAAAVTVRLRPLRVCWVRVVVDDRTDARELQPGEEIRLEAQRAILLRVGDAGALSVELNGRVLPPLGGDGQVVERRFTAPAQ
jgi:cell division septum initiation protein DivIVA